MVIAGDTPEKRKERQARLKREESARMRAKEKAAGVGEGEYFGNRGGGGGTGADPNKTKREACWAKGWRWNESTQTCDPPKEKAPKNENIIVDKREDLTVVTMPDGRILPFRDSTEAEAFINRQRERLDGGTGGLKSGGALPTGLKSGGALPTGIISRRELDQAELQAQQKGQREEVVGELLDPLISRLEEGIEEQPLLEPDGIGGNIVDSASGLGAAQATFAANQIKTQFEKLFHLPKGTFERATKEEFLTTAIPGTDIKPGKALGLALTAAEAAALAVGGWMAIPIVLKSSAATAITAKVASASTTVKMAAGAIIWSYLGGGIRSGGDLNREKMKTYENSISTAGSTATTVKSAFDYGADGHHTIKELTLLADTLDQAEQDLIEAARFNIKWRTDEEYKTAAGNTKKARSEILERVRAVRNALITGKAGVDPENLMITLAQFGGTDEE